MDIESKEVVMTSDASGKPELVQHGTVLSDQVSVDLGTSADLVSLSQVDRALAAKMNLVNDVSTVYSQISSIEILSSSQAIDELGFTGYHWKLFFLNGFG